MKENLYYRMVKKTIPASWNWLKQFPKNIKGTLKCIKVYWSKDVSKLQVFSGYWHWYFAKWYADKRTEKWVDGQGPSIGKWNYVLVYADESLIVCNASEVRRISIKLLKGATYRQVLKTAYYDTKNQHNI